MKKITQEQINGIINLLVSYNVGIKDFEAIRNMFDKLPLEEVKEEIIDDKKEILDK